MPTETCVEAVDCSQATQATKSNTGDCAPQAAISASIIEFSIAFLKLPQIVAKYLFNRDEDKAMTKTISRMQKYNLKRYNGSFKHKK